MNPPIIPFMSDQVYVRDAQPVDAPAIETLYRQLVNDDRIRVTPARIQTIISDARTRLLVCDIGLTVCATVLLSFCLDPMYGDQPFAVIENLIVDHSARGRGIGDALLQEVERICVAQCCSKMMLLSSTARLDAHRFFERHGFRGDAKRGFVKYRRDYGNAQ